MSIQLAKEEYAEALAQGKRELKRLLLTGKPTRPAVLDDILDEEKGVFTCLDGCLLLCACALAAGLYPAMSFFPDHVITVIHLEPSFFAKLMRGSTMPMRISPNSRPRIEITA